MRDRVRLRASGEAPVRKHRAEEGYSAPKLLKPFGGLDANPALGKT